MVILIWALAASLWALVVTIMLVRNPLPLPDRGHRAYALPSEDARQTVLRVLSEMGLKERFTFDAGPTHQTLMWDGYTVLNHIDENALELNRLPANAISIPTKDPRSAAEKAASILKAANHTAVIVEVTDAVLRPNHLIVLESDAFKNWVLVFRRHVFRMPKVERRRTTRK
jgi:hypothetical protein